MRKRKFTVEQLNSVVQRTWPSLTPRLRWEICFRLMATMPSGVTLDDYMFSSKDNEASPEQCLALALRYCMPGIDEATERMIDDKTQEYEYPSGCINALRSVSP